jgi:hypothetical protein
MWKTEIILKKSKSKLIDLNEKMTIYYSNFKQLGEFLTLLDETQIKSIEIKRSLE